MGRTDFETLENGLCAKKVEKSLAKACTRASTILDIKPIKHKLTEIRQCKSYYITKHHKALNDKT